MTDTVNTPNEQDWYFTFGSGQQHDGKYVVIHGTPFTARDEMVRYFGNRWSFQYPTAESAGVDKFGLVELPRSEWPNPDADRQLLAAAHRFARTNGWHWFEAWGWVNADNLDDATRNVEWDTDRGTITVRHNAGDGHFIPTTLPAGTVREAIGRLVALDVLPAAITEAAAR